MTAWRWVPSSKCCWHGCPMTLCTPVGGGLMLCWLHVLAASPAMPDSIYAGKHGLHDPLQRRDSDPDG